MKIAAGYFLICICFYSNGYLFSDIPESTLAITNGYIIDGNGGAPIKNGVILIKGERIEKIGSADEISIPYGVKVINVEGKTLMPGLADMHVHFMGGWDGNTTELLGFQKYLNAYLYSGVTTILDMGNIEPYILQLRREVNAGTIQGPKIYCVGPLIDGPDAQWPSFSVSISSNSQIPSLVKNLKRKNVDLLKAYKGLSFRNIAKLVDEAKKNSLKVIVDQSSLNGSYNLSRLDIEAFAHLPGINKVTNETMALMKSKNIKCMTTLTVTEYYSHQRLSDLKFIDHPLIKNTTPKLFIEELVRFANRKLDKDDKGKIRYFSQILAKAKKNLKKMYDAGLLLIAGTDAPYPGVFQGESIHRELELIVASGLTPLQAITLATKNGSILLGEQKNWGTLENGKIANILVINGRPDLNISHTRNIEKIIFKGKILDRDKLKIDNIKDIGYRAAERVENN